MVDGSRARVAAAVVRHLGGDVMSVHPVPGGFANDVFRVSQGAGDDLVVRLPAGPEHGGEVEYGVEVWAAAAAGAAGVPVAEPVGHGRLDGLPYSVFRYVTPSQGPVDAPWTWLGRYAGLIATADLAGAPPGAFTRFGTDLDRAWSAHLAYHRTQLDGDDPLRRDGAYVSALSVHRRLDVLAGRALHQGLAHGDLAPRNLVGCGPAKPPVLVDWGAARTGPAPWTDARRVLEWAVVDGEVPARGYDEFAAAAGVGSVPDRRVVAALTAVHLVDVARWARDRRPDLYDASVARCRRGLALLDRAEPT